MLPSLTLFAALLLPSPAAQGTPVQEAFIKASNAEGQDRFGSRIDYSGDTLIVVASREDSDATCVGGDQTDNSLLNPGAAYVFVRSGTTWAQQAYLKSPDTGPGSSFGAAVAIDGDWAAVVGRAAASDNIYIYERTGSTWGCHSTISSPAVLGALPTSLAVTADRCFLGAPDEFGVGATYVFARNGTQWAQEALLMAMNPGSNDEFGRSVSVSGDTLVIGARREASNGVGVGADPGDNSTPGRGAAYVYTRTGTVWTQEAYLKPTTGPFVGSFGNSVSISGDTLAVGAPAESTTAAGIDGDPTQGELIGSGAAYIYVRSGTTWSGQAFIKAATPMLAEGFAWVLDLDGDLLAVGAPENSVKGSGINGNVSSSTNAFSGAAYAFERSGSQWSQAAYIKSSVPDTNELFGDCVAVSGTSIVVSSLFQGSAASGINGDTTDNSADGAGACFAFDMDATVPNNPVGISLCNGDGGDQLGCVNCPCSNNSAPGTTGGCLNSVGLSARLAATGDPSVSLHHGAYTDLRIALSGTRGDSFCVLLSGDALAPQNMANPCFGISNGVPSVSYDGLRCAVGNLLRHGGRRSDLAGDIGATNNPWGGEFNPQAGLAQAQGGFVAGQARYFQVVYRDLITMSCTRGLGTTQAIEIVFTP